MSPLSRAPEAEASSFRDPESRVFIRDGAVFRALTRSGVHRVLVVAGRLDDAAVLAVTEAGACGLL